MFCDHTHLCVAVPPRLPAVTVPHPVLLINETMDSRGIAQVALEVCDLMQEQLDSIMGRKLSDFTPEELDAYQKRKSRIGELRSELHRLAYPI